jgi:predicted transcriptional regulator
MRMSLIISKIFSIACGRVRTSLIVFFQLSVMRPSAQIAAPQDHSPMAAVR